jgi:hypothetical protein
MPTYIRIAYAQPRSAFPGELGRFYFPDNWIDSVGICGSVWRASGQPLANNRCGDALVPVCVLQLDSSNLGLGVKKIVNWIGTSG